MTRRILMLGRHGRCLQKPGEGSIDALIPETVREIYEKTGVPLIEEVIEYGIAPRNASLTHTKYKRTKLTGQAVLAGAFGMQPRTGTNPPKSQEDLANYDFSEVGMIEESRLCYGEPGVNIGFAKDGNYDPCIDFWLANPEAEQHDGVPIIPYRAVSSNCKSAVKDAVARLMSEDNAMGVIVAHATTIDTAVLALIETAMATPVREIGEIGGGLKMAEFAQLTIKEVGGICRVKLDLRNTEYEINLSAL